LTERSLNWSCVQAKPGEEWIIPPEWIGNRNIRRNVPAGVGTKRFRGPTLEQDNATQQVREGLNGVTASNWSGFCQRVASFENEYWVKDGVMEDATDSFVINLGTSESDDVDSESSNHAESEEDSDSDLAHPLE
jgi:hypothetical protein